MANDCLVTKLKATIQKDLPELGELEINLKAITTKCLISLAGASPFTIKIKGSGHFYDAQDNDLGQIIQNYNSTDVYINNTSDNDKLSISNKYQLSIFYVGQQNFVKVGTLFDVEYLEKMDNFFPYMQQLAIDLDTLAKYSKDITTLLTVRNNYATGSIEKVTENICALGRTSGTLKFNVSNTSVTFNDNPLSDEWWYIDFSATGATVRAGNTQKATYNPSSTPKWTYVS